MLSEKLECFQDTGIVRIIDELGKVVLPVELRRKAGLEQRDGVQIYFDEESGTILLTRYEAVCSICKEPSVPLVKFHDKLLCADCIREIRDFHSK